MGRLRPMFLREDFAWKLPRNTFIRDAAQCGLISGEMFFIGCFYKGTAKIRFQFVMMAVMTTHDVDAQKERQKLSLVRLQHSASPKPHPSKHDPCNIAASKNRSCAAIFGMLRSRSCYSACSPEEFCEYLFRVCLGILH